MWHLRKRADKSGGPAAKAADLPGAPPGVWPLAGVEIVGDITDEVTISQKLVLRGITEGWIDGEDHDTVARPAGKAEAPWDPTPVAVGPHVFHHFSHLTIAGVRFEVVHQPDKYARDGDDDTPVTDEMYAAGATEVDWFYRLRRADN